jgi:hypothetical protein
MKTIKSQYGIFPIKHPAPGAYIRGEYVREGFVVTRNGCNIMPGATWFRTSEAAQEAIRVFDHVKEDPKRFWRLLHRVNGVTQRGRKETLEIMTKLGVINKMEGTRHGARFSAIA